MAGLRCRSTRAGGGPPACSPPQPTASHPPVAARPNFRAPRRSSTHSRPSPDPAPASQACSEPQGRSADGEGGVTPAIHAKVRERLVRERLVRERLVREEQVRREKDRITPSGTPVRAYPPSRPSVQVHRGLPWIFTPLHPGHRSSSARTDRKVRPGQFKNLFSTRTTRHLGAPSESPPPSGGRWPPNGRGRPLRAGYPFDPCREVLRSPHTSAEETAESTSREHPP